MQHNKKTISIIPLILLLSVMAPYAIASSEFYIFLRGDNREIYCKFLEIKDEKALCKDHSALITYSVNTIDTIKVIHESKEYSIDIASKNNYTKLAKAINGINEKKIVSEHQKRIAIAKRRQEKILQERVRQQKLQQEERRRLAEYHSTSHQSSSGIDFEQERSNQNRRNYSDCVRTCNSMNSASAYVSQFSAGGGMHQSTDCHGECISRYPH